MKIIQKAVVQKNGRFLVLFRSSHATYFPLHWDFPGGKLELCEEPFAGVEREVFEETGLKVKAVKVVGTYEFDLVNVGQNTHRFTVYLTKFVSGDMKLSPEHTDFRWVTKNELLKLKIEPYIKLHLK